MKWIRRVLALGTLIGGWGSGDVVLDLDFDVHPVVDRCVSASRVAVAPRLEAMCEAGVGSARFLSFDGRTDTVVMEPLSSPLVQALSSSFTLELDVRFDGLPSEGAAYPCVVEALGATGEPVLVLRGHKLGRYEVTYSVAGAAKSRSFLASWHHPTPTAARIIRGRWTRLAVTATPGESLRLFVDGEVLGSGPLSESLRPVRSLRFGGGDALWQKFDGGIDNVRVHEGAVYSGTSAAAAGAEAARRLREESRQTWTRTLRQEPLEWAEQHPRLVVTPSRLVELERWLATGRGAELRRRLIEECERWTQPGSADYHDPKEFRLTADRYVELRPALLCLGTLLSGDARFAERAGEIVTRYAEELGYHDVSRYLGSAASASGTTMMMALAYDWGYAHFTPEQRETVRECLVEIAAGVYDALKDEEVVYGKWVANWSGMATSALGHAALAIAGETDAPVRKWLDLAKHLALIYGSSAADRDGAFHEGTAYFFYGAQHLLVFLDALFTATGDDLLRQTNLARVPDYLAYMLVPWGEEVMPLKYCGSSADFHNRHVLPLYRARAPSKAADWVWDRAYGADKYPPFCQLFGILWYRPEGEAPTGPGLPLAKWFGGEGLLAFRSGWGRDDVAGAFYAHHARIVAHDQADRGQFVLYGYGGRWIIDSGGRQLRHSGHRDAHNLVTVDGVSAQPNPLSNLNWHTDSFLVDVCHADEVATAGYADLTPSYRYLYDWGHEIYDSAGKKGGSDAFEFAHRWLLFVRMGEAPPYLLSLDDLQVDDAEHLYTWHLHTGGGNRVTLSAGRATVCRAASGELDFLYHPLASVGSPGPSSSGGFARFDVRVPVSGRYTLWGFGRAGDVAPGGMDSFFVDFADRRGIAWSAGGNYDYKWLQVGDAPFQLDAGETTLTVRMREPEARVSRFALVPEGSSVVDVPGVDRDRCTFIDATRPDELRAPFRVGTERKRLFPEGAMELALLTPAAPLSVKPFYPEVTPPHPRFEVSLRARRGRFFAWCYPRRADMEVPKVTSVGEGRWCLQWQGCTDWLYLGSDGGIDNDQVRSDARLVLIRREGEKMQGYVMQHGSRLDVDGRQVVSLEGATGTAMCADGHFSVSGRRVTDFRAADLSVERVTAHGRPVGIQRVDGLIAPGEPILSRPVLTW